MALASAIDFFRALWGESTGIAELRCPVADKNKNPNFPVRQEFFKYPNQLDAFLALAKQIDELRVYNVWFGLYLKSERGGKSKDAMVATALWVDVDFKVTPREKAREAIKGFPLRPSAGTLSGGGYHVYWFLKDPVTGDELRQIPSYNKALAKALGGDLQRGTLADCPRIPGTMNVKPTYSEPQLVDLVAWYPTAKYSLSDFSFLPIEEPPPTRATQPISIGNKQLDQGDRVELMQLASAMWTQGNRHAVALYLAGLLVKNGYSQAEAEDVVRMVATVANDHEIEDRLMAVRGTYAKAAAGEQIAGYSQLTELVKALPDKMRRVASQALHIIEQRARRHGQKLTTVADLSLKDSLAVTGIRKKPVEEPEFVVDFTYLGEPYACIVDGADLLKFRAFKEACVNQLNLIIQGMLPDIDWEGMLRQVEIQNDTSTMQAQPTRQVLRDIIIDVLKARGVVEKLSELTTSTVYHNETHIYFKWETIRIGLRGRGTQFMNRDVMLALQELGAIRVEDDRIPGGPDAGTRYWSIEKRIVLGGGAPKVESVGEGSDVPF